MDFIGYTYLGLAHAVFAYDYYLDWKGKTTLSDRVFSTPIPNWTFYVMSLVGYNLAFWVGSPELSGLFLGAWLLGHFSD
jgi:hypothetical protein